MRNATLNPSLVNAAWMPADNSEKRTKGQWHSWLSEAFTFFKALVLPQ